MRNILLSPALSRALLALTCALVPVGGCDCEEPLAQATGAISGKVCNPLTGAPAGGALLVISYTSDVEGEVTRELPAQSDGTFMMAGVPTGSHTLFVRNDEFETQFEVVVEASETTVVVDEGCRELAIPPGKGEIIGQICNRHVGEFVTDALVRVLLPSGEELSATTDDEGEFILRDVPVGVHVVYATAAGYSRSWQVEVKDGEQTLLEEQQRECTPPDPSATGFVRGRVCAEGEEGLGGVRVFLTSPVDGYVFEDQTAPDGTFKLAGIPAPSVVQVKAERAGFVKVWNDVEIFSVENAPDGTTLDAASNCSFLVPDSGVKYLVVDGTYDKIQQVLQRMELENVTITDGVPADLSQRWGAEVFGDYAALNEYDAVFVNCGVREDEFVGNTPDSVIATNLRRYVQQGGSLYISDQAYDLI
ncbi:MAG: carboxypeptidase regulatory-like domain-containing protein, partial [Myxococcota bacterium]